MTQHTHQYAISPVKTIIHVAEERHQAAINAAKHVHLQEVENVRREAHNTLTEQANRHA